MTNLCERFVRVPQRERIASPSREARASCIDGVAKPTAPTQRLPALHLRPGARGEGAIIPPRHEREGMEVAIGI
jgi:hypothetical protein